MSKSLLTQKGRLNFSMTILVCCLVLMFWATIPYLRVPPPDWVRVLANWTAGLSFLVIAGLGWYVGHVRIYAFDLLEEGAGQLELEENAFYAWKDMKTEVVKFSQMSWQSKLTSLGFIVSALALFGFGIADFTGLVPQLVITTTDGERIPVSHWLSGLPAIMMSFIAIVASNMFRFKTTSRADEALRELIKKGRVVPFKKD